MIGFGPNVSLRFDWDLAQGVDFWDLTTRTGEVFYPPMFKYTSADINPLSLRLFGQPEPFVSQNGSFAYINLLEGSESSWLVFDGVFGKYSEFTTISYIDETGTMEYRCLIAEDLNGDSGYITGKFKNNI